VETTKAGVMVVVVKAIGVYVEAILVALGTVMYELQNDNAEDLAGPWNIDRTALSMRHTREEGSVRARASNGTARPNGRITLMASNSWKSGCMVT
jgi:hypothetical protein